MSTSPFVSFEDYTLNSEFPEVMDISPTDIQKSASSLHIVDVRSEAEYTGELGHIAGSQLLELHALEEAGKALPTNKSIVFVCRSGRRSAQACDWAKRNGFNSVFNLKGGMILWNQHGLGVQK